MHIFAYFGILKINAYSTLFLHITAYFYRILYYDDQRAKDFDTFRVSFTEVSKIYTFQIHFWKKGFDLRKNPFCAISLSIKTKSNLTFTH